MADILRLEAVSAGYGATVVLDGVSLTLAEGARLAVLGRNGVGKTTLMRTIVGQTRLHSGRAVIAGTDAAGLPGHRRAALGLGYVPQGREVFPSLTVDENLSVAARPGAWTRDRVYTLFPQIAVRRGQRAGRLSGGEQQMLSIGRALVGNPGLLLLDEPMEGLAPVVVEELAAVLGRLGDIAIVLVEQYASLALDFAPRCLVLDRGRVAYDGASAELAGDQDRLARLMGMVG